MSAGCTGFVSAIVMVVGRKKIVGLGFHVRVGGECLVEQILKTFYTKFYSFGSSRYLRNTGIDEALTYLDVTLITNVNWPLSSPSAPGAPMTTW